MTIRRITPRLLARFPRLARLARHVCLAHRGLVAALVALAATTGIVAGALTTTAGTAHASSGLPLVGNLLNASNNCLGFGDPGFQPNPQDPIQEVLEPCAPQLGEEWTATPLSWGSSQPHSGAYQLKDGNGFCLGVRGGSTTDGAPVEREGCTGSAAQSWQPMNALSGDPNRSYELINPNSGKCLGIFRAATTVGSLGVIWDCNTSPDQRWNGIWFFGTLVNVASGQCMGVYGASTSLGAAVVGWGCQSSANQAWELDPIAPRLQNSSDAMCLDSQDNSTAAGTPLVQWECISTSGEVGQPWQYQPVTSTEGQLVDEDEPGPMCLTQLSPNTQLVQEQCNTSPNQLWTFNTSSRGA
jgi:Ricin-type beta-trefoil lectin domain-like